MNPIIQEALENVTKKVGKEFSGLCETFYKAGVADGLSNAVKVVNSPLNEEVPQELKDAYFNEESYL